jgi:pimeloyl-ACP methyl ester carboxylesterase
VTRPGPEIHVEVTGEGPALVFTHGFGGSVATWKAQVERFAPRYRTFCWDLLGHGQSAVPEDPTLYSRERALDDLAGLVEQAGGEVVLVGHSLGGYLSLCHALEHVQGIRGLALVATGPGFRDPEKRELWNERSHKAARLFGLAPQAAGLVVQPDDRVMAQLEELAMPVLLVAAERDRQYRNAMGYMQGRIANVEHLVVEGAGHLLHETHPEAVNDALDPFLAACWA